MLHQGCGDRTDVVGNTAHAQIQPCVDLLADFLAGRQLLKISDNAAPNFDVSTTRKGINDPFFKATVLDLII